MTKKCNIRNFRWFLCDMSPDITVFKVCIFTSDFKFELEEMNRRHSNSKSFDLHCLTYFAKGINLWWMVSLWCELLCTLSIYTLTSDR